MSSPDEAASMCEIAQAALHAILLDDEHPSDGSAADAWAHVAACDRCTRALAHDRAMRRALGRVRDHDQAPDSLRERLRRVLAARGRGNGSRSS